MFVLLFHPPFAMRHIKMVEHSADQVPIVHSMFSIVNCIDLIHEFHYNSGILMASYLSSNSLRKKSAEEATIIYFMRRTFLINSTYSWYEPLRYFFRILEDLRSSALTTIQLIRHTPFDLAYFITWNLKWYPDSNDNLSQSLSINATIIIQQNLV